MKDIIDSFFRITLFAIIIIIWWWVLNQKFSNIVDITIIIGGILLIYPIAFLGRKMLYKNTTMNRTTRITTLVHYSVVILAGTSVIRAIKTHQDWSDWLLPIPTEIGLVLVTATGAATLLAVINLAVKGFGAPFAIALSRKLAIDWMYAWTRNPMVLSVLAFGISLGIWFQSILFILLVLIWFTPALLILVKIFEERELEIRFGASYVEYKSRTPMLFPRKPKGVRLK